jgi:hypothetical protein
MMSFDPLPRLEVAIESVGAQSNRCRPGHAVEITRPIRWNEAAATGINITVFCTRPLMSVKALRHDEVQLVLGERHGDGKENANNPPFGSQTGFAGLPRRLELRTVPVAGREQRARHRI